MKLTEIVQDLYVLALGPVNVYFIRNASQFILIDTGYPGDAPKIIQALEQLGGTAKDIRTIILTHCHPDHAGSLPALKKLTNAKIYISKWDTPYVSESIPLPIMKPAPGIINRIMCRIFVKPATLEPTAIDYEISDGEVLSFARNLRAIHVPGHSDGQLAFLWPEHGGVLFAADACANMMGLGWSIGYEDLEQAKMSLRKLSALDFEVACFGHGKPIVKDAALKFRQKWGKE